VLFPKLIRFSSSCLKRFVPEWIGEVVRMMAANQAPGRKPKNNEPCLRLRAKSYITWRCIMQTTYFWIGLAVILVLLDAWIINSIWRSDNASASKAGWSAVVVVLPFLGAAIWAIAGPRGVTKGPSSPEHSKG